MQVQGSPTQTENKALAAPRYAAEEARASEGFFTRFSNLLLGNCPEFLESFSQ